MKCINCGRSNELIDENTGLCIRCHRMLVFCMLNLHATEGTMFDIIRKHHLVKKKGGMACRFSDYIECSGRNEILD